MDPAVYSAILDSLAEIDFAGTVAYARYNEPLADRIILERIAEARRRLPLATLHTNTNGDYLDRDYLEALYEAGLRSLKIQIYLRNEERYSDARIHECAERTLARVGVPHQLVKNRPGDWLEYRLSFRDMDISAYGRNFERNGSNRGGLIDLHERYVRYAPCLLPRTTVHIDYNGKMVPCCNFRSDAAEHADYVIGELGIAKDIFAVYAGRHATNFRASVAGWCPKKGLCRTCKFGVKNAWRTAGKDIVRRIRAAL